MVEFLPFATDERLAYFKDNIKECASFNFWDLTIGDFSLLINNKIPEKIEHLIDYRKYNLTIRQYIEGQNAIEAFMDQFKNEMEACYLPPTAEEEEAMVNLPKFTVIENMLIFVKERFVGKDYEFAEKLTLYEYRLEKKKAYSDALFNRNLERIRKRNALMK